MKEKTEREKMLNNELYLATDPELLAMQLKAQELVSRFNLADPNDINEQKKIILNLFSSIGNNFIIRPPFYCDYGSHIIAGDNLYINFDCTILDCNWVQLGNNVLLAPKVQIYTAYHPTDPELRLSGKELAAPVTIGDNVWLGGEVIICPGVNIGSNVTIGAGSVVTKNVPDNLVAVGNPCRVLKSV
ncbi:MAG: sugar O-acetyltransferase [Cyanobacteria bacterium J06621_8]